MAGPNRSPVPAEAWNWLVPTPGARVLAVGETSTQFARYLPGLGHNAAVIDRDPTGVKRMLTRVPRALGAVAEAEALPFAPCTFDTVLVVQSFHAFAPGLSLGEFARVLKPQGNLAVVYTVRDDSVPWVRRLTALVREVDPDAMAGNYGAESVQAIDQSRYFPVTEHRDFRRWVPVSRIALLEMVARSFAERGIDQSQLSRLLSDVGQLYDNSARAPEPLLLPYRIACTRGWVDHTELTAPIEPPMDGLRIIL